MGLSKGSANTLAFGNAPALADITVRPLAGANGTQVVGKASSRCLDVYDNTVTNGTQGEIWDCNGGRNQSWTYTSRKELVVYGTKCLDAYNQGTTNGTKVVIWDCDGQNNQKWNVNGDGTITDVHAGLCLDVNGAATANRSVLVLWSCSGATNQSRSLN